MAETFITASTRITFSSIANTGIALKRLRDGMKHAPGNLVWLSGQLDCLQIIISDLETSIPQSLDQCHGAETLIPSMKGCQAALDTLQKLVEDLSADIFVGKWNQRAKAKFKAVMKEEQVKHYRHRLELTICLLGLAQQSYAVKLTQLLPQQLLAALEQQSLRQSGRQVVIACNTESVNEAPPLRYSVRRRTKATNIIEWQKPQSHGYICYKSKIAPQYPQLGTQLQVQFPRWLVNKTWDICLKRACSGWKINICWSTIHGDSFARDDALWQGPRDEIFKALAQHGFQLYDRFENGNTLTQHALMCSRIDIALELLEQGAPLDPRADFRMGLYLAPNKEMEDKKKNMIFFTQQLILRNMLDEVLENPLQPALLDSTLNTLLLDNIDMFNLLIGVLEIPKPAIIWNNMPWWAMPAKTAMALFNNLTKDEKVHFYESVREATAESINRFTDSFFTTWMERDVNRGDILAATERLSYANEMCTILGAHAPLHMLSPQCLWITPLHGGLIHMRPTGSLSWGRERQSSRERECRARLQQWLQALSTGGVNLEQYGCQEATRLQRLKAERSAPCFGMFDSNGILYYPVELVRIDYGPKLDDWKLYWEYCHVQHAREFWQNIEFDTKMPGAWIDD